jgi:plastocyanin
MTMGRALVAAMAVAGSCLLAPAALAAQGSESRIAIDNFTFSPAELTVAAGTSVTWTNDDDIPHTLVARDKLFRSKALDTGDGFTFTFTTPGTYDYFCGLHPHMVGKIVVTP